MLGCLKLRLLLMLLSTGGGHQLGGATWGWTAAAGHGDEGGEVLGRGGLQLGHHVQHGLLGVGQHGGLGHGEGSL